MSRGRQSEKEKTVDSGSQGMDRERSRDRVVVVSACGGSLYLGCGALFAVVWIVVHHAPPINHQS